MRILQLTSHFAPNMGGVETHLTDLVSALTKRRHKVFVLTYRPLTTKTSWKLYEKKVGLEILRIPWFPGFFYKLVSSPILEFLYLLPGLFVITPFVIFLKSIQVIHGHGLVAGAVSVFWGKIFGKKVLVSTHSIYHFPKKSFYRDFVKWIFLNADYLLALSGQSANEISSLGIPREKIGMFTYWINLDKFKPKENAKEKLGWNGKFVVLFVGRLIEEKGLLELLKAFGKWDEAITLAIAGSGPLEKRVSRIKENNFVYLGKVDQDDLPLYYSAADLLVVPSIHEEGFGRVILESLACGTPVIGSKRGAIPEAMDKTVGELIRITPEKIKEVVEYFYKNSDRLKKLSRNTREFAEKNYSEKNVEEIIKAYRQ